MLYLNAPKWQGGNGYNMPNNRTNMEIRNVQVSSEAFVESGGVINFNQADSVYFGELKADKVYLGAELVWELIKTLEVTTAGFTTIYSTAIDVSGLKDISPERISHITWDDNRVEGGKVERINSYTIFFTETLLDLGVSVPKTGTKVTIYYK